jgi:CRISPR-associated endoribonuclease Cas6
MDLLSLVLTLRPLRQPAPDRPLSSWWGRAAHALLLNVVRQYNPSLAESLHDNTQGQNLQSAIENPKIENSIRPFTVSTLIGRFSGGSLDQERPYTLRLTAFSQPVADILMAAALSGPLSAGSTIELDYLPFQVEAIQPPLAPSPTSNPQSAIENLQSKIENPQPPIENSSSPWAAYNTYQELAAPLLLTRQAAPRQVTLSFTSPTTFKSGGMHVPVPLPGLTFGSLLDRWNAYAPICFPPEARRYAEECLAISRYKLSSRSALVKRGGQRIGGVGEVTYTSLNYDLYWMSVIGVLAAFALFCGVGAGASMGLGQCRVIVD